MVSATVPAACQIDTHRITAARRACAKVAAQSQRAGLTIAGVKTLGELGGHAELVPKPPPTRVRIRAHQHLPRPAPVFYPADIWCDHLWYGLQPHTGLHATGFTREAVSEALRGQLARMFAYPLWAVTLTPPTGRYPWGIPDQHTAPANTPLAG